MKFRVTLKYKTSNGNEYLYDDSTGLILNWNQLYEDILNLSEELSYEEIKSRLIKKYSINELNSSIDFIRSLKEDYKAFYREEYTFKELPSNNSILDKIGKSIANQLTLSVTDACNLRCKYCIYSDAYYSTTNKYNNYMSIDVATKAIDYFCSLIKPQILRNPFKKFKIGFYGGEPLLNMEVINFVVNYIKSIKLDHRFDYSITTNGILLDKEKIKFFSENNFSMLISLDGPKKENDRLRVNVNGNGSYDEIIKNIDIIKKYFPKYYKRNVKLTSVFDVKTDLQKTKEFFNKYEKNNGLPNHMFINPVNNMETNYYEQFSEKDFNFQKDVLKKMNKEFFDTCLQNKKIDNYLEVLINSNLKLIDLRRRHLDYGNIYIPYSGTCFPGQKLFVDYKGIINICEKVNGQRPIGNINTGLDIDKIKLILSEYRNNVIKDCHKCPITKLCLQCFQHFQTEDKFKKNKAKSCDLCINSTIKNLSFFTNILEENPYAKVKME